MLTTLDVGTGQGGGGRRVLDPAWVGVDRPILSNSPSLAPFVVVPIVVGFNHRTLPLALRERLAVSEADLPETLARLGRLAPEAFVLSTCNRVELWAAAPAARVDALADQLLVLLVAARGLDVGALRGGAYVHRGAHAVRHLCRVAAGLDSMVLGEGQIAGQLRRALGAAHDAGTLGPALHRLGATALEVTKAVRFNRCPKSSSVAHVAVAAARATLHSLHERDVLVLGAGEMAALTVAALRGSGARVTVVNRTLARAEALAAHAGASARPWVERAIAARDADVVIACVGAPEPVLDGAMLAGGRTRVCYDLGVPAAIAGDVREVGVALENVDSLAARAHAQSAAHAAWLADAEARVEDGVRRYAAWRRERDVAPAIRRLHAHAARVRDAETQRALARLRAGDIDAADVLEAMARRISAKLLHVPVTALKDTDRDGTVLAAALTAVLEHQPAPLTVENGGGHATPARAVVEPVPVALASA